MGVSYWSLSQLRIGFRPIESLDDDLARRRDDLAAFDHLCRGGMADACAMAGLAYLEEPSALRGYLTAVCQAGGTSACAELARRLTPTCTEACMAPDAAQAEVAAVIACDAGFADVFQLAAL